MFDRRLRRLNPRFIALACLLQLACASTDASEPESRYLSSADYREQTLRASLVEVDNDYRRARLERYGEVWSILPEWNPPTRPVVASDIGAFVDEPSRPTEGLAPVFDRAAFEREYERDPRQALLDLGARAFEEFPMGVDEALGSMLDAPEHARVVGLDIDDRGRVGGLARLAVPAGEAIAPTCATCHSRVRGGVRELGPASIAFDYGAVAQGRVEPSRWGAGRVDVTPDAQDNPVAIADLRATRHQVRLHRAATVRNGLIPLALRIETLLITDYGERLRPPREIALALAVYLFELGGEPEPDDTLAGAGIYGAQCAGCHGVGVPRRSAVELSVVGTDPRVGLSRSRGTGEYRVPSLVGVLDRPLLLNRGEALSVRELLDDDAEPLGHDFGRALDAADKDAIVAYLASW